MFLCGNRELLFGFFSFIEIGLLTECVCVWLGAIAVCTTFRVCLGDRFTWLVKWVLSLLLLLTGVCVFTGAKHLYKYTRRASGGFQGLLTAFTIELKALNANSSQVISSTWFAPTFLSYFRAVELFECYQNFWGTIYFNKSQARNNSV